MKTKQIAQKNGKNGTIIGQIKQVIGVSSADFSYVCLRWNALRRGRINVANTYQLIGMCYVLSIVSGKKYRVRHIHVSPR